MSPYIMNIVFVLLSIWTVAWKGYSLWISAQKRHRRWFVVLLLLNTLGILDIYYIFKVAKKSKKEVLATFHQPIHLFKK